ncbi:hypothetical protein G6O69_28000 [Pseudenhygromyxa sp. WMMC2535]|uniref:hypothetical protein n=1 Tax=Pseudenhygromyxa sp. WMMC2535 TaxID=2712867 RepID=UPI001595053D|nr:hypothetical protein [Pseudenhygromyxa sp. WMMC2535]NVB41709.1 hypothetical protein [Pseudenhygromyxa sp. WMMC2535]
MTQPIAPHLRRLATVLCSALTAATLTLAPLTSLAAPPTPSADDDDAPAVPPAEAPARTTDVTEAKRLFDAGVARYSAADYGAAIDYWLEANTLLPPTAEFSLVKAELIYNVARAQQKWFEIDDDVKHLRQAREILSSYLGDLDSLYDPAQATLEREKLEEQIADLDAKIAAWEEDRRRREAELAERMRPSFDFAADAREAKRNKAMLSAGATLTAFGLAGVGMFSAGVALASSADRQLGDLPLEANIETREQVILRGQGGTALIVVGSISGLIFLSCGVPLVAVAAKAERGRKKRRAEAGVEAAAPLLLPGGGGVGFVGRF